MKKILLYGCFAALLMCLAVDAFSQARRRAQPRQANPRAAVQAPPPAPEPIPTPPPVVEVDTIPLRTVAAGRRPSTTVAGNLVQDKTPLAYDNIRIDDQVYRQVIWRVLDTREKMNLPFIYEADEDNGNQRFFNILLKHIKEGDVTAFENVDDRFTNPLEVDKIANMLAGTKFTVMKIDYDRDPDGSLGIMKDTTIRMEFDDASITAYSIKEEVIFDRETSRLHWRILGIAPMRTVYNDDGSVRDMYRLFWLYYPDLRPYLAKYEAYNPRNLGARMSWEEIFESRFFASYITKSTINNPFDKPLAGFINDPLMRLLEGENIKETIFNWEQDQWSY